MAADVAHVGNAGDAHQTLLDIVGLHSGSVEYHQRYAESLDQLYNKLVLELGPVLGRGARALAAAARARSSSRSSAPIPTRSRRFWRSSSTARARCLTGPVVDDVAALRNEAVRAYTPDGKNYIDWLATSSLDVIRRQDFGGNPEPVALLYLLLRHAMMLGHWDAGIRLLESRALVDSAGRCDASRRSSTCEAVAGGRRRASSSIFTRRGRQITGDTTTTLARIRAAAGGARERRRDGRSARARRGARVPRGRADGAARAALRRARRLLHLPPRRLEDRPCDGAARGDARAASEGEAPGLYLGAFGWLENLRPKPGR